MEVFVNITGTLGRTNTAGVSVSSSVSICTVTFPRDVSACFPTATPFNNLNLVSTQVLTIDGTDITVGSTNIASHGLTQSAFFLSVYCAA